MRPSKSPLRLSTVVAALTLALVSLYCLYILPMAFRSGQTSPAAPTSHTLHDALAGGSVVTSPIEQPLVVAQSTSAPRSDQKLNPAEGSAVTDGEPKPQPSNRIEIMPPIPNTPSGKPTLDMQPVPFPAPIQISSPGAENNPAVLVVGGTDGSGTRRVVQILAELGVVMVSEDPETYDIHADLVKGWPEVVTPVIRAAQSLDYQPADLAGAVQTKARKDVAAILGQVRKDSVKPQSFRLAVGGVLPHPQGVATQAVQYGFKAPVAMTLSPLFAEAAPHFKLVHVLRDGRDISFSANQGPVDKFFHTMYAGRYNTLPGPVKGIKLWSDWNAQVYKWSARYAEQLRKQYGGGSGSSGAGAVGKSFGYFAVHSEDLVSPSVAVRYAAIRHLAAFVGSSLTAQQLCCLALKESDFMGSHDRTPINKRAKSAVTVTKRYGKWHAQLDKNPTLSRTVHEEGAEGLRLFGYEPSRGLADDGMREPQGDYCSAEVVAGTQCAALVPQTPAVDPKAFAVAGMCSTVLGLDFVAGKTTSPYIPGSSSPVLETPHTIHDACR